MTMAIDDAHYTTSEMYLAALLLAKGFILAGTSRRDPTHIKFEFNYPESEDDSDTSLDSVVRDYMNGISVVVTTKYVESLRKIKTLIFAD
jgi:hypothetical protein